MVYFTEKDYLEIRRYENPLGFRKIRSEIINFLLYFLPPSSYKKKLNDRTPAAFENSHSCCEIGQLATINISLQHYFHMLYLL